SSTAPTIRRRRLPDGIGQRWRRRLADAPRPRPMTEPPDPHRGQPVLTLGPAPENARLTMIMAHGRGASAEDMMGLAAEFGTTDVAFLAPQAAGRTWYPYSFLSPLQDNEPGISSALRVLAGLVDGLIAQGIAHGR